MKKFIVFAVLTLVSLLCFVPVYGEEISLGTADDSVEVGGAEGEIDSELPEGVTEAYLADNGGYVFMLTTKGYGGDIKLICGILDGKLTKIKTLSHNETSGIGSKVVASDYGDNYIGKTAGDYSDVDSVTGATISSKAYKKAVGNAFDAYDQLTKEAK